MVWSDGSRRERQRDRHRRRRGCIADGELGSSSRCATTSRRSRPRVFAVVNGLPASLWPVLWAPVQLGSFAGSLVVTVAAAAARRRRPVTLAALARPGPVLDAKGVKHLVRRGRPAPARRRHRAGTDDRTRLRVGTLRRRVRADTALAPELPRRVRGTPFMLAAVVAGGRVYAGAHLPLDVVGGIGMGVIAGRGAVEPRAGRRRRWHASSRCGRRHG